MFRASFATAIAAAVALSSSPILLTDGGTANAAELNVIASNGMRAVLDDLAPLFERKTEHKLNTTFAAATPLKRRIDAGESFDVVILTPVMIEDLVKQGKVASGSKVDVAKTGIGMAIRAGEPKPDISTTAGFKSAVLNAKSIIYSKEGQSGAYMASLIERLGIADQMTPKTILETGQMGRSSAYAVAEGKAQYGFMLVSEILPVPGAEVAAMLPAELQFYVAFSAGIAAGAKDKDAAQALVDFIRAPTALPVLKAKGMEPG